MTGPALSIITPCLNRVDWVARSIESVLAQKRAAVEHLVVDGGSTDGTLAVLQRFPHLRLWIGADQGMYDALNKGIALAQGEIIGFLNSDDTYPPGTFDAVLAAFDASPALAVAGEAVFLDPAADGTPREAARFRPRSATLLEHATIGAPAFNAWFFRRSVFESLGPFDVRYRIAGDREFMLRFAVAGLDYTVVDSAVYQYWRHAESLTFGAGNFDRVVAEHVMMTDDYLARGGLTPAARALVRRLRTRDTLNLAVRCAREKRIGAFLNCVTSGTRRDPLWTLRLARRAVASWR